MRPMKWRGRKKGDVKTEPIEPMDIREPEDGDKNDITSIAFYQGCLSVHKDDITRVEGYVDEYIRKFEEIKSAGFRPESKEYQEARSQMFRWIVALDKIRIRTEFYRPNTTEDIRYRQEQLKNFPDNLKTALPKDLDLRFHATSIGHTQKILQNKEISSIPFRYDGYICNSNGRDWITAVPRDNIKITIQFWADLDAYKRCLPAGCVFALLPKDQADIEKRLTKEMGRIDFEQNPEQLFGIITTPENIERVKEWMREATLNPDLVYTYEEFLEVVEARTGVEDSMVKFRRSIADRAVIGDKNVPCGGASDAGNKPTEKLYNGEEPTEELDNGEKTTESLEL